MFDTLIRDDALVFVRGTLLVFLKRDVPNITKKKDVPKQTYNDMYK